MVLYHTPETSTRPRELPYRGSALPLGKCGGDHVWLSSELKVLKVLKALKGYTLQCGRRALNAGGPPA